MSARHDQGRARGWPVAAPEDLGFSADRLGAALERFRSVAGRDGIDALTIARDGHLVHAGPKAHVAQGVWSITKTFLSTAMGVLFDDGKFALDQRVGDVLPELKPAFAEATFRQFASMTSGYRAHGDDTPIHHYAHGPSRTPYWPATSPQSPPGSTYSYWDSAPNMLALALTRLAGEPLADLLRRRVMAPIGLEFEWGAWLYDGLRVHGGAGNHFGMVQSTSLDVLRLGELYRKSGSLGGRQVLSAEWCTEATSIQVGPDLDLIGTLFDGRGCYGLFWWLNGEGPSGQRKWPVVDQPVWSASGHNNNDMFVVPGEQLVICRLGMDQDFDGPVTDEIYADLVGGIVQAL